MHCRRYLHDFRCLILLYFFRIHSSPSIFEYLVHNFWAVIIIAYIIIKHRGIVWKLYEIRFILIIWYQRKPELIFIHIRLVRALSHSFTPLWLDVKVRVPSILIMIFTFRAFGFFIFLEIRKKHGPTFHDKFMYWLNFVCKLIHNIKNNHNFRLLVF